MTVSACPKPTEVAMEILADLFRFLRKRKKWWLAPMISVLLLLAILMAVSATAAGPFVYTIF